MREKKIASMVERIKSAHREGDHTHTHQTQEMRLLGKIEERERGGERKRQREGVRVRER